jgi:chromosome segregation ATPase
MVEDKQTVKMIEWLDEERRKDRGAIARLEEQISQQNGLIGQLTRRLNGLESDQSAMRDMFLPVGRYDDILQQLRTELRQAIEQIEDRRSIAERESGRRDQIAREGIIRPVRELGDRLDRFERTAEELPAVRVEIERLTGQFVTLQQRLDDVTRLSDEPERRLTFMEEKRRQDARRISELQTELPEIQKQVDQLRTKLELLEEMALRNEKRLLEILSSEREQREQIQQFIDQQSLLIHQRDQQIEELVSSVGAYDEDMLRYMERFESWAETYRQMKKIVDDFERIGDRLERRINEVAEMQRLSEERFRQEWNEFGADDQKRWKQFTLTNDEGWREHDKQYEQDMAELGQSHQRFPPIEESLERLWALERARARLYSEQYQALLQEYDRLDGQEQLFPTLPASQD